MPGKRAAHARRGAGEGACLTQSTCQVWVAGFTHKGMEVLHTQEMVLVDDEQVGKPKVRSHSHPLPPSPPPNYDATHPAGSVLHNSCQIFLVPPLPPLHHVSTSKKNAPA